MSAMPWAQPSSLTPSTCSSPLTEQSRSTALPERQSSKHSTPRPRPSALSLVGLLRACLGLSLRCTHQRCTRSPNKRREARGPLGPLLFAMAVQGPLQRISAANPYHTSSIPLTASTASAPSRQQLAFDALAAEVCTLGVTLISIKSTTYSPEHDMMATAAADVGVCCNTARTSINRHSHPH
jgi:hypothetical protein